LQVGGCPAKPAGKPAPPGPIRAAPMSTTRQAAMRSDQVAAPGPPRPSRRRWRLKYIVEYAMALAGTIAISPLLALLALLVKITSAGPALYVSERLGKDGKVFRLYKFRSMKVGAEEVLAKDGKVITLEGDPRITKFGRLLRLGFDELPQLFNVLKGDMCLVGPRPDVPWELPRYSDRERVRLAVLPGITGLTQVVGGRELSNAQNYELDVRYVCGSSAWTDLAILALTLPYCFGARKLGRRVFRRFMTGLDSPPGTHPTDCGRTADESAP